MTVQPIGALHEPPIELRLLVDAVADHLRLLDQLDIHVGEVPTDDALPVDNQGRVFPYAVLWPNMPAPAGDGDLADAHLERDWSLQVTVAAGWHTTALDRADQVHHHLHRWAPSYDVPVAGGTGRRVICAGLQVPPGYQPPIGLDRDVTPPRHFVPLQYRTTATT